MLSDLRTFLLADSTVDGLVDTRMYPDALPQAPVMPAIVYTEISAARVPTMDGPDGLPAIRVQIDAWAATALGAQALADAIRQRLDGHSGAMSSTTVRGIFADTQRTFYDSEPKLYRKQCDYIIWALEPTDSP
jgi:hypothetical protein